MNGAVMVRQVLAKALQELQWHVRVMTKQITHVASANSPLSHLTAQHQPVKGSLALIEIAEHPTWVRIGF